MWSKLNFIGVTVLPMVTIFIAGLVGRAFVTATGGDLNRPIASMPFFSQLAFIAIHLTALYIATRGAK